MSKSEKYKKLFNEALENSWDNTPREKPRKVKKPKIKHYDPDNPKKYVYIRKKEYWER
jgi:hypothetical protein